MQQGQVGTETVVRVPFSSAQWPKDPGPNNCFLVDWAWFTTAKELFKNQVVYRAGFLQYKLKAQIV